MYVCDDDYKMVCMFVRESERELENERKAADRLLYCVSCRNSYRSSVKVLWYFACLRFSSFHTDIQLVCMYTVDYVMHYVVHGILMVT